ncbi:head-to-tail adaptor [Gordonia phage Neville]|uniref:Head-to-tail adaptor n=2 Tax=Nevillevirus TaxID=3044773 RepID=A0A515MH74_9CAUD|nr:head-to-tail adaptor [Gordonia phage Neville]YP_010246002.1 head-to-tail adaptor [Gordonia phage Trax]AXQ64389.1 head-to-tail adaptor [Gordonia phage Neville]QDM55904.1 head-to-tail adaptor [Gordonia phage Trax]
MEALATVDRLATRLGIDLPTGSTDRARAEDCLWSASVRARVIAEREWADPTNPLDPDGPVPESVVDVVLMAAMRMYRNPDRFIVNQAGSFQATLPQADFTAGDIFLRAEVALLEKARPRPRTFWTIQQTREDSIGPADSVWGYPPIGEPMPVFGDD